LQAIPEVLRDPAQGVADSRKKAYWLRNCFAGLHN
jgi:hypothetical protein